MSSLIVDLSISGIARNVSPETSPIEVVQIGTHSNGAQADHGYCAVSLLTPGSATLDSRLPSLDGILSTMPAIFITSISNPNDDNGYSLSRPTLTAIIVCTILFILLLLGFTLVWCYRRTSRRPSSPATSQFVGRSNISSPAPAHFPQRSPYPMDRFHG
ncbi:hypothetical protein EDD18DRAFT_1465121 [Armillaria luteobubalina]|uniref:Uncharacterized protein n=1 Tax=Armillaria luteobubalina TaxID=153913 RepID=A0AA39PYF6_9AGAR|nr:hypothetical protein EDD18DRAFT_1465121 [Armillaria luteobubalina]